jgi:hypothetical protein
MTVSTDRLGPAFLGAIKLNPFFKDWRKKGTRAMESSSEPIHRGVGLVLFKGSFERAQHVGIAADVSVATDIKPILERTGTGDSKGGRFHYAAYLSSQNGIGEPTFKRGAIWTLMTLEDLEKMIADLHTLIDTHLIPWFQDRSTVESFVSGYEKEFGKPYSLPLTLFHYGKVAARKNLLTWLATCPADRPQESVFSWAVKNELLTPDSAKKLALASIQMLDTYREQTQRIVQELQEMA